MATSSLPYMKPPPRFHFNSIPGVLFKPRQTLGQIIRQPGSWLTPLLVLTLVILVNVLATGWINQQRAASGVIETPPDFQYWNPEIQNQYMQSQQVRQGPVFHYVIPGIGALAGVWFGWLIIGGMLHLMTTILGGRGETSIAMNLVAWSNLPFIIREIIRAIYILSTKKLITAAGLSGFLDGQSGNAGIFLASLLALIDIYLIWQTILLVIGVNATTGLTPGKSIFGAVGVIVVVVLLQALLGYLSAQLGALTVVRPFLF